MKLADALLAARQPAADGVPARQIWLSCGFNALHLKTYLAAYGRQRFPESGVSVADGLFGDFFGNLERSRSSGAEGAVVVVEWSDLDPRLGLRHAGGMGLSVAADTVDEARRSLDRIRSLLAGVGAVMPVAIVGPTLPLPPLGHTYPAQMDRWEVELMSQVASAQREWVSLAGVRTVSSSYLSEISPPGTRRDVRMDLASGFPYTLEHAAALAGALIPVLYPSPPKKGLITDLDNTLWKGIIGEDGPDGVAWSLSGHAQHHGLYQQFLAALAERGVLIAIASKNDPDAVVRMLSHPELLLPNQSIFPVEANWGPKSESVGRILDAWNIHSSDVIFIDDSPLELAEVRTRFPEMEIMEFPASDGKAVWRLLLDLQHRFGKPRVGEEDRIRAASLRTAVSFAPTADGTTDPSSFLAGVGGEITIDWRLDPADARALELVNKTNQFNLNGRRYSESDWSALLAAPGAFLQVVSYQDRFGPLGKIAVAAGRAEGGHGRVEAWVMSCRAFSRQIEHHMLDRLFARLGAGTLEFDLQNTGRNAPAANFLAQYAPGGIADRERFVQAAPVLPHKIEETNTL